MFGMPNSRTRPAAATQSLNGVERNAAAGRAFQGRQPALPEPQTEAELHRSLLMSLGRFLTKGMDFCYIGSEYPVPVGSRDFALDLSFFQRGMSCLAIELKVTAFEPEHLGKLNFDLEALDRDVKKPHENPAIGLLLCTSKDSEVVEYALSHMLWSALVARYQMQLPEKGMLAASCTKTRACRVRKGDDNLGSTVQAASDS
jgi:hypothetical protein